MQAPLGGGVSESAGEPNLHRRLHDHHHAGHAGHPHMSNTTMRGRTGAWVVERVLAVGSLIHSVAFVFQLEAKRVTYLWVIVDH